jgi:hypothetical protein
MKTRTLSTISIVLTFGALSATAAVPEQAGSASKPAMGKMVMSPDHMVMATEPHHVLAMAYHQNLAAFAKALHEQAASEGPLNIAFARTEVSEMRRSFDQMKQHNQEHMDGMSPEMHAKMDGKMSGMMEKMQTHQADMNTQLTALEQEINSATPDPKKISTLADSVHTHLTEMAKMHEGC